MFCAEICKNPSKRHRTKLARVLCTLKVSFVAIEEGFYIPELLKFGITPVSENDAYRGRIAEMALAFSHRFSAPHSFFIEGGGFFTVTATALRLLSETNSVFVSCADEDAVAEACLDECGACVTYSPSGEYVKISLFDNAISFRETHLAFSDFTFLLPSDFPFPLPQGCIRATVAALSLSGATERNDIKICIL